MQDGIDVISMGGLTFKRALEICLALDRDAVVLQDNDGNMPEQIRQGLEDLLEEGKREVFVGDRSVGHTLEPQLLAANDEETLRVVLGLGANTNVASWMSNNKTEAALRIHDSDRAVEMPPYIVEAIGFLV